MHFEDHSVVPTTAAELGALDHSLCITGQALPVKHRLHESAQAQMVLALTGEQPLPEKLF